MLIGGTAALAAAGLAPPATAVVSLPNPGNLDACRTKPTILGWTVPAGGRMVGVMAAETPEAIHELLQDAFNRSDLDALMTLYEDDAALVVPPGGEVVYGRDAIRAAVTPHFALRPRMTSRVRKSLEADGLALTHASWELVGAADDGTHMELAGRGTIVSRRRPDGTWGIVLDDPLSPA